MLRKSGRLRAGDLTCKGNPTKVSLAYIPFLAIYRSAHGQQNLWAITKKDFKRKTPPQKDNKKPILRISVEEPAENPQALLFAHVRKGRKQPVNCPRPRYLRSAAKNDLSIRAKPQPYMGKMRACGVPYALILAYASQKQLPKFGCS